MNQIRKSIGAARLLLVSFTLINLMTACTPIIHDKLSAKVVDLFSITLPVASITVNNQNSFTITGACNSGRTVTIAGDLSGTTTCSGGTYRFTHTPPADGTFHYRLTQIDSNNNKSTSQSRTWIRDTLAPDPVQVTAPATTPFFSGDDQLIIAGLCEVGATVYLDDSPTQTFDCLTGTFNFIATRTVNDTYTFNLLQKDAANNSSALTTIQWVRDDSLPPTPTVTTPTSYYIANNLSTLTISGGCITALTVTISGDHSDTMVCTASAYSFTINKNTDNIYHFGIKQTSLAGIDSAEASVTWERDTVAPAAPTRVTPAADPYLSGDTGITITGACETGATVNLTGDSTASQVCANSQYAFPISKNGNTTYTFSLTQTDRAGNQSSASTLTWTQDTNQPPMPVITNPATVTYLTNTTSIKISGTCVTGNTVYLTGASTQNVACASNAFEFTVTATTGDGLYHHAVKQRGYINQLDSGEAVLDWTSDTTPPAQPTLISITPSTTAILTASSLTPKLKGTTDAGSIIKVYRSQTCTGEVFSTGSAVEFTGGGVTATVTANDTYDFSVKAFDLAGNASVCASTSHSYHNRRAMMVTNYRVKGSDSSAPTNLFEFNGYLYFRAFHANTGYELYRTDGTPGNTKLFKNISVQGDGIPANAMTSITNIYLSNAPIAVGSWFYFAATDDDHGTELWKSNGTAEGTSMVKDIYPDEGGSNPYGFTLVGSTLYFKADDGTNGEELWKTDGTEASTMMVKNINSTEAGVGAGITYMAALGTKLIFFANDGINGLEPWVSDGAPDGTQMISNLNGTSANSSPNYLVTMGGFAYFSAYGTSGGSELWKTDGTLAGTSMLDLRAGGSSSPTYLTVIGNTLYFRATSTAAGAELWKSDGTLAGSSMVKDIEPGSSNSSPYNFFDSGNGFIYFVASTSSTGYELWRSDGTDTGTTMINEITPGATSSTFSLLPIANMVKDGKLYFQLSTPELGSEPWVSDGTEGGTFNLKNFATGPRNSSPSSFKLFNSKIFFTAYDSEIGTELRTTDGTSGGTQSFYDLNSLSSGSPNYMTPFGVRFVVTYWSDDYGRELYLSDGTTAGTTLLTDLAPGTDSSSPVIQMVDGNKIYFYATDDTYGTELFISDGTPNNTKLLSDINPGVASSSVANFNKINDRVVFRATTADEGTELWTTDGTPEGTTLLKDIYTGATSSNPGAFMAMGGYLYFSAIDETNGAELWRTNGTDAGTTLVKNIVASATGSSPTFMTLIPAQNKFIFRATTSSTTGSGVELWISDGTDAGTMLLKDIYPGGTSSSPSNFKLLGDKVIFTATTATAGTELWITDGTPDHTTLLKDIRTGAVSSSIANLTVIGNKAYFSANDGVNGIEPWVSDGTDGGTFMIKNIAPGAANSGPLYFTDLGNGQVAFRAQDGVNGWELWRTNGSAANTYMIQNINTIASSYISSMLFWNNKLYFNPNDGVNGYELWSY